MNIWRILGKINALLVVTISIAGTLAISNLASHIHPVMPEEIYELFPAVLGFFFCLFIFIAGIIFVFIWFGRKKPRETTFYVLTFISSLAAIVFGYFAGNDLAPVAAVTILGIIIFLLTCLMLLFRHEIKTVSANKNKIITLGIITGVFLVLLTGFVGPQWFDAARNFPDHNLKVVIRECAGKSFGFITNADLAGITSIDASYRRIGSIEGLERCINLEVLDLMGNWVEGTRALSDISPLKNLHHL